MRISVGRLLATVGIATAVVSVWVAVIPSARSQASVPNDQLTISVSGSLSSMSSHPAFFPAFSPSTHDYAMYCQSGVNVVSLTFGGVTPSTDVVSLGENQAAVVQASNGQNYWIRCLPHDFPVMKVSGSATARPGWYLTGNAAAAANGASATYAMVLDSNGTPVWYQRAPGGAINVEALANDTIAWMPLNGPGIGANPAIGYKLYNLDNQTTRTLKAPISPTDPHELLPLANGNYMMIGTPLKHLTTPFNGFNNVVDCVVQEVTSQGNLVWSWRASDHVAFSEGVHDVGINYNGQKALEVYHCNSVDVDPTNDNVLVSMRDTSALYLIGRRNASGGLVQNGPIIWKLQGCGNSQVGPDKEPVLTVQKDPESCFDAQHDARFRPNGGISIYDDHTYQQGGGARGVEYSIDTANSTATWQVQYPVQPGGANAAATGDFRRYLNGTDNLVGWGFRAGSGFTEFDASGNVFFSMTFPNGDEEYRVVKVPLSALQANSLRASAGLPRPTFPTVHWATLGGISTSNPAVAAWSSNRLDVFVRGTDGGLWHAWWDGTAWRGWESLGGLLLPGTGPAVASWAPGRLDVFVEGTNKQLWHRWYDSAGWHGWEPRGGVLTSSPAAVSWGLGRVDVVADGIHHDVWHIDWNGTSWSGWQSLGGVATSAPGITSWAAGRLDVFVKGTDNQLWHKWFMSNTWSGWENLGGNLTAGPSATSLGAGLIDVAAAGAGDVPERLPYDAGWQVWQPLPGSTPDPPALAPFRGGEDIFVTGTRGPIYYGSFQ